jgi:hypothetical protein
LANAELQRALATESATQKLQALKFANELLRASLAAMRAERSSGQATDY